MTEFFSLVGETQADESLGDLFSQSTKKSDPGYDYSEVDAIKRGEGEKKGDDDSEDNDDKVMKEMEVNDSEEEADDDESQDKKAKDVKLKTDKMAQVKHEDTKERIIDEEKEKRTVFVGNLPVKVKKPSLKKMFSKFGKIETIRFRCAGRPDLKTTKKVAVIKQNFHEERQNICAYVRMSSVEEAEACCSLNGSTLDGLTIRVDMALKGKVHDNKVSVFLGNLHFNTTEEDIRLLFSKVGEVDNVRLIRDPSTGLGKGFGYVNFVSEESVAKAMRLNGRDVAGRKVRVNRAVRKPKSAEKHKEYKKLKNRENKRKGAEDTTEKSSYKRHKTKGFQGVNTSKEKKFVKNKNSKQDRKHKTMAKILNK